MRRGQVEALRKEIARWGVDPKIVSLRQAARELASDETFDVEETESHLRAALAGAGKLVDSLPPAGIDFPPPAKLRPLVDKVVEEADACWTTSNRVLQAMETKAAGHVEQLRSLEFKLFGFVLIVLLLEGLFVISPAVSKLQQIIAEMDKSHRDLKSYAAKLERSNRELQDFASVASHDLQEPLRKVQAFSDRLATRYGSVIDEQGRDYLERVQSAGRRMQTLINDLLTYSRVTTKAMPFEAVDLAAATREVLTDLEVRIERTGGRVEISELPTIEADPDAQVRQLMQWQPDRQRPGEYHRPEAAPVGEDLQQRAARKRRGAVPAHRGRQRDRLR